MNFKNTNKYLYILLLFLFSCKSVDILSDSRDKDFSENNIEKTKSSIDVINNLITNHNNEDFYKELILSNWKKNTKLKKLHTFKSFGKKYNDSRPLKSIIYENNFIFLTHESKLNFYDLKNFKLIKFLNLNDIIDDPLLLPTSVARNNDNLYISYLNGLIICVDFSGNLLWSRNFNDILKTPIKFINKNIIILLSDKIISINSSSGNINWEFNYEGANTYQALGGDIINLNHLLFFILPNNRVGEIDIIFGEKIDKYLSNIEFVNLINNSFDKLHKYKEILSYFDQNKYLTSINTTSNTILFDQKKINNVSSSIFLKNILLSINKSNVLEAYNIIDNKFFWKSNLSNIINNKDKIINSFVYSNSLLIFFQSGKILELNTLTGEIMFNQDLKLKNVIFIDSYKNILLFTLKNGNTVLYKQ